MAWEEATCTRSNGSSDRMRAGIPRKRATAPLRRLTGISRSGACRYPSRSRCENPEPGKLSGRSMCPRRDCHSPCPRLERLTVGPSGGSGIFCGSVSRRSRTLRTRLLGSPLSRRQPPASRRHHERPAQPGSASGESSPWRSRRRCAPWPSGGNSGPATG
jgi:hypothetical protein